MPPKKDAGPSAQEIEEQWKKKEEAWLQEEQQLEYLVKLTQEDTRHYRMRCQEMAIEVEMLQARSQHLESKSVDLRVQFLKQSNGLAVQQHHEVQGMKDQEALLEEMNSKVHTLRATLSQLTGVLEATTEQCADQVRAVAFRNSGISALREKVVKQRSERNRLLAEMQQFSAQVHSLTAVDRKAAFIRKPSHFIVVGERCASLGSVAQVLQHSYSYDVTLLVPSHIATMHRSCNDSSAADGGNPGMTVTTNPQQQNSLTNSIPSSLSAVAAISPSTSLFCVAHADEDLSTALMRNIHALFWSASRGLFYDDRQIIVVVGIMCDANPQSMRSDSNESEDLTAIQFYVPCAHVSLGGDNKPDGTRVVVSVAELLDVAVRRSAQSNVLVVIELVAFDYSRRTVILASGMSPPTIVRWHSEAPASPHAPLLGGGSSVCGIAMLQLLDAEKDSGRAMSAVEVYHRLYMKLLLMPGTARGTVPRWMAKVARKRSSIVRDDVDSDDNNPTATEQQTDVTSVQGRSVLLPQVIAGPPITSTRTLITCRCFVKDGCDPDAALHSLLSPYRHSVIHASLKKKDPLHRAEMYFLVTGSDVCSNSFVSELVRVCNHQWRMLHGTQLSDAERSLLLPPLPIRIDCVCEAAGRFVLRVRVDSAAVASGCTLNSVGQVPPTLRGSDRAPTLATNKSSAVQFSVERIVSDMPGSFPESSHVTVTAVTAMEATVSVLRGDVVSVISRCEIAAPLCSGESIVIAPAVAVLDSVVCPLEELELNDTLHLRHIRNTPSEQQVVVLVVISDAEVASEQRAELLQSASLLQQAKPPCVTLDGVTVANPDALSRSSRADSTSIMSVFVPCETAVSTMFATVHLSDLQCSPAERQALFSDAAPTVPVSDDDLLQRKRRIWRNVLNFFPQRVVQFLLDVTFPCTVVSSPCIRNHESTHGIVIPRSLETRYSAQQPYCLFRHPTIVKAVAYFYTLVLRAGHLESVALGDALAAKMESPTSTEVSPSRSYSSKTASSRVDGGHVSSGSLPKLVDSLPSPWMTV